MIVAEAGTCRILKIDSVTGQILIITGQPVITMTEPVIRKITDGEKTTA